MHKDSAVFGVLLVVKYIGSVIAKDGGLFLGVRLVRQKITQWSGGPPVRDTARRLPLFQPPLNTRGSAAAIPVLDIGRHLMRSLIC